MSARRRSPRSWLIPALAAALLALLPGYRLTRAPQRAGAALLTFLAALSLFCAPGRQPALICLSTISTSSSSC